MILIYDHIDYREYLSAWFEAKKEKNSRFSHRMFSRLMDQKSPSFLKDIIQRRRNLTIDQQKQLCKVLKLNAGEFRYLCDMILLDHSDDNKERARAFERMAAARRINGAKKIQGESFRYFSRWYCPAIRELASHPQFKPTPEWIIEHLRPSITKKQAKEALQILQDTELLKIYPDGTFEITDVSIVTPMEVSSLAGFNYHTEMLQLAKEGLDRFDPEDRHYMALTVCIPPTLLPKLKEELNQMAARLLDLCDSATSQPEQVMQLHLHCFPLSAPPQSKTEKT